MGVAQLKRPGSDPYGQKKEKETAMTMPLHAIRFDRRDRVLASDRLERIRSFENEAAKNTAARASLDERRDIIEKQESQRRYVVVEAREDQLTRNARALRERDEAFKEALREP